jgi:hypothetical protein
MPVKRYDGTNWVTVAGDGIQGPAGADGTAPLSTKGQLLTRNSSAVTALSVGTNNQVLTADSAEATGLKWTTPSIPADSMAIAANTTFNSVSSISFSGLTPKNTYYLFIRFTDGSPNSPTLRINGTSNNVYYSYMGGWFTSTSTDLGMGYTSAEAQMAIARKWTQTGQMIIRIDGGAGSGLKTVQSWYSVNGSSQSAGYWNNTATITSFELTFGTATTGDYLLMGV